MHSKGLAGQEWRPFLGADEAREELEGLFEDDEPRRLGRKELRRFNKGAKEEEFRKSRRAGRRRRPA